MTFLSAWLKISKSETQGAYDQQSLFEILVKAASSGDSIENTAKILKNVPTANDIRYHLDKINNFELLETQINQALKSRIPANTARLRKNWGLYKKNIVLVYYTRTIKR